MVEFNEDVVAINGINQRSESHWFQTRCDQVTPEGKIKVTVVL